MKTFRLLLAVALAAYMTGACDLVSAQETDTTPLSITLAPLQFAYVKGNVGKFEALNWMKDGADAGVSEGVCSSKCPFQRIRFCRIRRSC